MDEFGTALVEIGILLRWALGLGLDGDALSWAQMAIRAVVVYVVTVVIVRLGKKRFMGRATAFDVILGIMLGSIVSRAITGNAPFVPALAAGAALIAMHWLFSWIALRWHGFGTAIKGHTQLLVRNGEIDWRKMRAVHMTERDLWEDLRDKSIAELREVAEARLERDGGLSVIKAKQEPKVVEVRVAEGVQTIRIELA
jgi:uncharacterized membrane protein YcaP (DUF421 family)